MVCASPGTALLLSFLIRHGVEFVFAMAVLLAYIIESLPLTLLPLNPPNQTDQQFVFLSPIDNIPKLLIKFTERTF